MTIKWQTPKDSPKTCFFSLDLKISNDSASLTKSGKEFQVDEPARVKESFKLSFRCWNNQVVLRRSRGSELVATLDDGLFDTESGDVWRSDAV